MVVGFLCIRLDFLVEVVVLVKGYWWVWIFYSFGFFDGGCGHVKGCWWWRLWLWVSGFAIGGGGVGLMMEDSGFTIGCGGARFGCITLHFMGFFMGEYERG